MWNAREYKIKTSVALLADDIFVEASCHPSVLQTLLPLTQSTNRVRVKFAVSCCGRCPWQRNARLKTARVALSSDRRYFNQALQLRVIFFKLTKQKQNKNESERASEVKGEFFKSTTTFC